jgi:hypothetical protein
MKKDLEKIKPIDKFNFICLRVLSDLENEIEQLQQKKMITANSEVAATKQGKEKCRKKK